MNTGYANACTPLSYEVARHPLVDRVVVLTPEVWGAPSTEELSDNLEVRRFRRLTWRGLVHRAWPITRLPLLETYWRQLLRPTLEQVQADVIWSDTAELGYLNLAIARHTDIPQIVRIHAATETEHVYLDVLPTRTKYDSFLGSIVDQTFQVVDHIASTNEYHLTFIKEHAFQNDPALVSRHSYWTIPNALPPLDSDGRDASVRAGLNLADDRCLIVQLGRMSEVGVEQKGFEDSLAALAHLRRRSPAAFAAVQLCLIGDGPERPRLARLVEDLEIVGHVTFIPTVDNAIVTRLLSSTDIFLAPSRYEGLSMVCLEAVRAGCPLVATDTGGLRDLVVHGQSGFLVQPRDVEGLADAIERLVVDEDLRKSFGAGARRRFADCFTLSHVANNAVECLRQVVHRATETAVGDRP